MICTPRTSKSYRELNIHVVDIVFGFPILGISTIVLQYMTLPSKAYPTSVKEHPGSTPLDAP